MESPKGKMVKDESFRDSIATIGEDGKRNYIHPSKPHGKLYSLRTYLSYFYLLIFFFIPFIKINGHPLFLINVLERKFILFGAIFWPQDFVIFGLSMITGIVFVALFTVTFGRIFCGWMCPQTIFLEMIFRRVEYLFEGDSAQQKALSKMPWNAEKFRKRGLKNIVFYLMSVVFANGFLAYIIGIDELYRIITDPISQHFTGFIGILIFSFVFFFIYSWFREQVCIVACPYGRLQGVLMDRDTIVVAYDYGRGEPRGKINKKETRSIGDCIDCAQCVKVCPTGIDIRNGTQLECVNCTACIDACDYMMEKVNLPKGLIRYSSENNIAEGKAPQFTFRMKAYSVVLVILLGILITLISTRSNVETQVLRTPGLLFQEQPNSQLSNLYNIKITNKTFGQIPITLRLEDIDGTIKMVGKTEILVKKESVASGAFFVFIDKAKLKQRKTKFKVGIYSMGKKIETVTSNFMAPIY